jgi:hypothetical protein
VAASEKRDSVVIEMVITDSSNLLEALEAGYSVEYMNTGAGAFITAIDSVANNGDFFWLYSVNDTMPTVAADRFTAHPGDIVRWHFRRVSP